MKPAAAHIPQHTAPDDPTTLQRRAADPETSVWVGASAGSGKTKVLTDRVLRLLLPRGDGGPGTDASRILCLTFTKAAAGEMALRLARRLSRWAVIPEDALETDMADLLGRPATEAEKTAARRLFAAVVDTPGGLKIMTIHAFCQSVLGRFPLEAGLPPHFTALEEDAASALLVRARDEALAAARRAPDTDEGRALDLLGAELTADGFTTLLKAMAGERRQIRNLPKNLFAALCDTLGIAPEDANPARLIEAACTDGAFDEAALRRACRALAEGTEKGDQPKSVAIQNWLDASLEDRMSRYADYRGEFLTKEGVPLKVIMTKKLAGQFPDENDALRAEADRIVEIEEKCRAARCAQLTNALLVLGKDVLNRYEKSKKDRAALDFDDLINRTLDLLSDPGRAGWVMFKLDGGLDHILIDEAQDTNPEQWDIVRALCEDFFAGEGARTDTTRTVFAVGDEKQSIYSFQRAAPERFRAMRAFFSDRVRNGGQMWRDEAMAVSFRSAPAVLQFVDEVFAPDAMRAGLGLDPVRHTSHRAGDAGLVELWPLFTTDDKTARDPWMPPLAPVGTASGPARLAEHIGTIVRSWLDSGEILESKGRQVTPGDILILVRRRGALVGQIIRALKTRNIPVGGVDRMVLKDQIAVLDLTAAAQVALLPADDLTLACLLKGPFIGWDDAALESVAAYRPAGQNLWTALKQKNSDIVAYIDDLTACARAERPYEFFSRVLNRPCPADPHSGMRALTARLGEEALDPVDELLNAALAFDDDNIAALQGFLAALEHSDTTIKREQEEAGGRVRIMTVHGAKGLQAPIVILPDTVRMTRTPPGVSANRLIWPDKSGLPSPLWSPRKDTDTQTYATTMAVLDTRQDEEYRRLLYVALTRAEDRLYIAGAEGTKTRQPESWYNAMEAAMDRLAVPADENTGHRRLTNPQTRTVSPGQSVHTGSTDTHTNKAVMPPWLVTSAPAEPLPSRPLTPSRPVDADLPVRSPLAGTDAYRFRRGTVTHKLLERLPGLPPESRRETAIQFTTRHGGDLPDDIRAGIVAETMAILENPNWAALFGPDSLAEVPVSGRSGTTLVSGQIDRLLVTPSEIHIVDYKTNRPPPAEEKDIPAAYRRQMALYSAVIGEIYPGRRVRCFLLWTDGPRMMEVTVDDSSPRA